MNLKITVEKSNLCFRFENTTCQSFLQTANMLPVHIQSYYRQPSNVRGMVSHIKFSNI